MKDTRMENCLKDFEKIDNKVKENFDLNVSELNFIIEKAEETSKTYYELIYKAITITYKIAFVLGRRSKK